MTGQQIRKINMADALNFEIEERPPWRSPEEKTTTSEMLREIAGMVECYETLPD